MKNKIIDFCLTGDKILIVLLSVFLPFVGMAWIYSVAYYFNSRLHKHEQVSPKMINFFGISPAICFILIFPIMFIPMILMGITENPTWLVLIYVLIIPIYLLLFASMFIMIYQSARAFSKFEVTRRPKTQDFILFLVIFWLSFIAIIMLQDDINKWYMEAPVIEKPSRPNTPATV